MADRILLAKKSPFSSVVSTAHMYLYWWVTDVNTTARTAIVHAQVDIKHTGLYVGAKSSYISIDGTQTTVNMSVYNESPGKSVTVSFSEVTKPIRYDDNGDWSGTIKAYWSGLLLKWNNETLSPSVGQFSISGTAADHIEPKAKELSAPRVSISASSVTQGSPFNISLTGVSNASSYRLVARYGSKPTKTSYDYISSKFTQTGTLSVVGDWSNKLGTLYIRAYAIGDGTNYTDSDLSSAVSIVVEKEEINLSTPSLTGVFKVTGGNSTTLTAVNTNLSKYPSSTVYIYSDSTSGSTLASGSNQAQYTFTPTASGNYVFAANVGYDGAWSDGITKTVEVTDPLFSPAYTPNSSQITSSVRCVCNASGTVEWFLNVGTLPSYINEHQQDTQKSTGETRGAQYKTGNNVTFTKEEIQECIINGASYDTLYFHVGCRLSLNNGYVTASQWTGSTSGYYTFGEFDGSVTSLIHWNNINSSVPSTVEGTLSDYFYDAFKLHWTNPTSGKLLGYNINNINVQASTDGGTTWNTLSSDMMTPISTTAGATNTITVNYKNYGAVKFRIKVDTSNNTSTLTNYETTLNSLQCQLSNLQVNTVNNLHPYTNVATILKFKWFDEKYSNFVNGEKIKIQFFINEASQEVETSQIILDATEYNGGTTAAQDDTTPGKLCYVDSAAPYYYYNLRSVEETNQYFFNALGSGVFDGLYKYRIQLTYTNNFGKSVVITSAKFNANFGQPPTFANDSEVDTRFYYYDLSGSKSTIFNILMDNNNTIHPATYKRMINPNETLVFKFPKATDPNNNLAAYRLEVYRFDDYNPITSPAPNKVTNYELVKRFAVGYGNEAADPCYYINGNDVYLYYTLGTYAYSKFCYFRIVAVDSYEDFSAPIYYPSYIVRGRVTIANLSVENVILGYYEQTTDTTPQPGTIYYTYDPTSMRYIKFNGTSFIHGVIYYTKTDGISANLKVNIGNVEPDLGGNYFRDSSALYSQYNNLEYYLQHQTTDERDYEIELQWSNNNEFRTTAGGFVDSYTWHMSDMHKDGNTYLQDLLTTVGSGFDNGTYKSPVLQPKFIGHKIYARFVLRIKYGKKNATTARDMMVTSSPIVIIYSSTPTIAPRANHIGINTNEFEDSDIIVVAQTTGRKYIRFHGEDIHAMERDITFNLQTGEVDNAVLDGGTW